MDGKVLPYSDSVVYLGVTLDKKLHWKKHINNKIAKAKARLMQLASIMRQHWGPWPKLMRWAFTSLVRPILDYAAFVWAHETDHEDKRNKLRKLNRLAISTCTHFPRSVPTRGAEMITDIMPLQLHLVKMAILTMARLREE